MSKIQLKLNELSGMSPVQIAEDERVQEKFVTLYNSIHGTERGELYYAKEKFNFIRLVNENKGLKDCTPLSLYGCFLDVAVNGLSLEQGNQPHVYVIPYSVNVGTRQQPRYEKRASLSISPYGELVMRMRSGQILHADNPIVVYEKDVFRVKIINGMTVIDYEAEIPRTSDRCIAAFMRIVRADGSVNFSVMQEKDIERLKGYSAKKNGKWENGQFRVGKPNALYTSNNGQIDSGFLIAKMIKHAFKTYPKVRTGEFTNLETSTEDDERVIDYGIEENEQLQEHANDLHPQNTASFAPPKEEPEEAVIIADLENDDSGF